jgi:hypothetical protein
MFEILKVTVIFGGGTVVKYQGDKLTALIGSREVNNVETVRDIAKLRVKDQLRGFAVSAPKRVILAYREKE